MLIEGRYLLTILHYIDRGNQGLLKDEINLVYFYTFTLKIKIKFVFNIIQLEDWKVWNSNLDCDWQMPPPCLVCPVLNILTC